MGQNREGSWNKLLGRWKGPFLVLEAIGDHAYRVQDLVSPDYKPVVHTSRLDFYADSSLDITVELKNVIAHHDQGHEVEQLVALKRDGVHILVQCKWLGLEAAENTWELLQEIHSSVPRLVTTFLRKYRGDAILLRDARQLVKRS